MLTLVPARLLALALTPIPALALALAPTLPRALEWMPILARALARTAEPVWTPIPALVRGLNGSIPILAHVLA
jgi:hypothetical protein